MEAPPLEFSAEPSGVTSDYASMFPSDARASRHSPLRPGSTLVPYQPNDTSGARTPGRLGKSQHLAQIRSLGLLHDLQEYISSVEHLAAEQKRELEKVKEEKRDMERFLARTDLTAQERPPGPVLDFSITEVSDLPPRLRALVEDNRGLRELVRRYKCRTASQDHQVAQLQAQVLALADANERLKQSLSECSRTPAEVEREETLRRQLEVKSRQLENLEHGMGVLRGKVETDSKLYRQNLAAAAREKDALKRQLVAANKNLEERDKELRAANVELRRARRGAPPTRGGPPFQPPNAANSAGGAADDDAATGAVATTDSAGTAAQSPAAVPAAAEPEERIRIMLIIVRDEIRVEVPVPVPVPVPMVVDTPGSPLLGSPRGGSEAGERREEPPTEADAPPAEAPLEAEPSAAAAAAEPAPAELAGGDEPAQPGAADTEPPAAEPTAVSEPEGGVPEPLGEENSASVLETGTAAGTTTDGGYEPSVVGLMEDGGAMALTAEASGAVRAEGLAAVGEEDGGAATGVWDAAAEAAAAEAAADAQAPPLEGAGGSGAMHTHASAPLPVPYSRTQARALAAKVGGVSSKALPSQPHGAAPGNGGAAGGPSRKASGGGAAAAGGNGGGGGGGGGGASGNIRGGPSLKAVGAASRKQQVAAS